MLVYAAPRCPAAKDGSPVRDSRQSGLPSGIGAAVLSESVFAVCRAIGACALVVILASWSGPALAQQPGAVASVRGRVLDPDGDGVAGAVVRVLERASGRERSTVADGGGRFVVANVAPGEVDVLVDADGFATSRVEGLRLRVGDTAEVDIEMRVSGVTEEVLVAATATPIDLTSSAVRSVVGAEEIETLPLNGRNFLELAFLTPGNAPAPNFDPTKAQSVIVSSGGMAGRGGNITVDGMDNNDDVVGGPLMNVPQDGVQEFQVATSRFSAELGRSAGSTINVVTRSGGSQPHGSASVYLRDQSWQATPATAPEDAEELPFDRQQYSFTLGGPLVAERLFGFGALEVRHQDGGVLVGERDGAARTIRTSFAEAPLDDLLGTARVDWRAGDNDDVLWRYSMQRADDVSASAIERPLGTASQRQRSENRFHALVGSWTRTVSPTTTNTLDVSYSSFDNTIDPVAPGVQLTFPSLAAGSSFRVPQATRQKRLQISENLSVVSDGHDMKFGFQVQRVDAAFDLGVFRHGRVELVEDFPAFDRNGDGVVNDDDLLFAVTLRSGHPDRDLLLPDADNVYLAGYVQDDWRVNDRLTVNLGLRYELDTDVKNLSRYDEINPLVIPFLTGERTRDTNNIAPRVGFNWTPDENGRTSVRGGYGIYYDRVTLQIQSLERGLDGRSLPIEVRAGNVFFLDPATGTFPLFAPTLSNPFTGFILPGAGASGINIIDNDLQNPLVHQFSLGLERQVGERDTIRADLVYNKGEDFIIGRTVGTVFNPVVGGPDRVVRLESVARTEYRALLVEYERRFHERFGLRAAYTLARARDFANDDQIPFGSGPLDSDDLDREFGPAASDRRHRLVLAGTAELGNRFRVAGIWTLSSGVPMDILMPDGQSRIPTIGRNAGGRQFGSAAELNAFIRATNAAGGIDGVLLPLVSEKARFSDSFNSFDLRMSWGFSVGGVEIEAIGEVFNLFDTTNILGASVLNYSGYNNVLVRDSEDPSDPGYLRSSRFGTPVSTAGGIFGSGGARALQLATRVVF